MAKGAQNPAELALVRRAIICGVTNCCEWDDKAVEKVRTDPSLGGLLPEKIRELLVSFVADGGMIKQVKETRGFDREFYYKVIVPVGQFKHGLFVELELDDDDPELPTI